MRGILLFAMGGLAACASPPSPLAAAPDAVDGVVIAVPLALDRTEVQPGDTVTATVTLQNAGPAAVSMRDVVVAGRRPGAANDGGPYDDFAPHAGAHALGPGESLTVTATRGFSAADAPGDWRAYVTWQDDAGAWHDGPSLAFAVGATSGGTGGGMGGGGTSGFVTASGGQLLLDGKPFRLVGANRYDVSSFPPGSGKYACGNAYNDADLDRLLDELHTATGATVLRAWAFQSFTAGGTDWSSLDRVVAAATRHGMKVIFALENEWTDCTERDPASADGRKSGSWYAGGYTRPLGAYPLSYADYVRQVVARYAHEPGIALWQLMNEAESDDAAALQAFTADVAGAIKTLDGNHLVTLGTIGTGQAGTAGDAYRALYAISALDVVEAHDYNNETVALPGAPSSTASSIWADLQTARSLGKPFVLGEVGIAAPTPMYPFSYDDRARDMDAKLKAEFDAGAAGFLVWSWYDLRSDNWQGWDFGPTDPLAAVLKKYAP